MNGLMGIKRYVSGGQIDTVYQDLFGRQPDAEGKAYWESVLKDLPLSEAYRLIAGGAQGADTAKLDRAVEIEKAVTAAYREQLGRNPTEAELNSYVSQLADGRSIADVSREIDRTLEGYNYDTERLEATYRNQFGRTMDQEGFEYWMGQEDALAGKVDSDKFKDYISGGANSEDMAQLAARPEEGYGVTTPLELAALVADPYGGRYASELPYLSQEEITTLFPKSESLGAAYAEAENNIGLPQYYINIRNWFRENPNATNAEVQDQLTKWGISETDVKAALNPEIGLVSETAANELVKYTAPVTEQPLQSWFDYAGKAQTGERLNVLQREDVDAAINRALNSGALDQEGANAIRADISQAKDWNDVYEALNKQKTNVVLNELGVQVGEDVSAEEALQEANARKELANLASESVGGMFPSAVLQGLVADQTGAAYPFGQEAMQTGYEGTTTKKGYEDVIDNLGNELNLTDQYYNVPPSALKYFTAAYPEVEIQPPTTPAGGVAAANQALLRQAGEYAGLLKDVYRPQLRTDIRTPSGELIQARPAAGIGELIPLESMSRYGIAPSQQATPARPMQPISPYLQSTETPSTGAGTYSIDPMTGRVAFPTVQTSAGTGTTTGTANTGTQIVVNPDGSVTQVKPVGYGYRPDLYGGDGGEASVTGPGLSMTDPGMAEFGVALQNLGLDLSSIPGITTQIAGALVSAGGNSMMNSEISPVANPVGPTETVLGPEDLGTFGGSNAGSVSGPSGAGDESSHAADGNNPGTDTSTDNYAGGPVTGSPQYFAEGGKTMAKYTSKDLGSTFDVAEYIDPETGRFMINEYRRDVIFNPALQRAEEIERARLAALAAQNSMARGGLANAALKGYAEEIRKLGRNGDTILAHINPQEAKMLEAMGGSGEINPRTGLPEYGFSWKKLFKVAGMVLPFLGLPPVTTAIASGALAGASTPGKAFDFKKGLMAGLMSYGASSIAQGAGQAANTAAAEQAGQTALAADAAGANLASNIDPALRETLSASQAVSQAGIPAAASQAPFVPLDQMPAGSGITDYVTQAGKNVGAVFEGGKAVAMGEPGARAAFAANQAAVPFGTEPISPTTAAGTAVVGYGGVEGVEEQRKYEADLAAIGRDEEEKRRRALGLFQGTLGRQPYTGSTFFGRAGGLTALARGGKVDPTAFVGGGMTAPANQPRMLAGGGDGMSDSIPATIDGTQPARLADGEFVIPADVVADIGNGSSSAGAKRLYGMMDRVRQSRHGTTKQPPEINTNRLMPA